MSTDYRKRALKYIEAQKGLQASNKSTNMVELTPELVKLIQSMDSNPQASGGKNFFELMQEYQQTHGCKPSEAFRATAKAYPEKYKQFRQEGA